MKLLEIIKRGQEKSIRILFGLFEYYRFLPIVKEIKIFGKALIRYASYQYIDSQKNYIEIFPRKNIREEVKEDCLFHIVNQVTGNPKNIVFIRSGLGEAYILNLYLNQYMSNYKLSNDSTCFVGLREYFKDLFMQYNPNVDYKKINLNWNALSFGINKEKYNYDKINIYFYIDKSFIYNLMDSYKHKNDKTHFFDKVSKYFSFKKECINAKPFYPNGTQTEKVIEYAKSINLNLENFVFLIKDAISIKKINNSFWKKIELKLKSRNYDVFSNDKSLTITDAKILASFSKGIISLRCGFSETLLELGKNMHILYTGMPLNNISSENVMNAYSLKKYPFSNPKNIFEYDFEKLTEDEIVEKIIKNF